MPRFVKLILALGAVSVAVPSVAAPRTFDFVARIDQPNALYATGTTFSGSFSYDDTLTPSSTYHYDPANGALYRADSAEYQSAGITLRFALGGQTHSGGGLAGVFDMIDQGLEDSDSFFIGNQGDPRYFFDLSFWAGNATTFVDTRLPASFPADLWQGPFVDPNDDDSDALDLIPHGEFSFYDAERQAGFNALVLSITPNAAAVPEPATWAMMIGGFALAGAAARRRGTVRAVTA